MRICHLADLHWRSLSRHSEYREVTVALIEDLREQNVDHIVIVGDLFHTKTMGISPEYIDQMVWFLTSLSDVAPVHVMLGNHDGSIVNATRQDAVTPIVDAMKNPNVHMYKSSGAFEFSPGFEWCNFGIFDKAGWPNVSPTLGKVSIACFHGPVTGSKTDMNWTISGEVSVEFFKDYDFGFLGDIHARQFLSERQLIDSKKPWIGYPGSFIQQSYGEALDHGYLLWDIRSREDFDVEFRKLPNPRPYITVEWDGNIRNLVKSVEAFPKTSRVRIKSSSMITQKEIYKITTSLQKFDPTEVTFKIDQQIDRDSIDVGSMTVAREDLRSADVLVNLVKDYYKDSHQNITDEEWTIIKELISKYSKSITDMGEITRNTKWSLKRIEFDNMYAYGENNHVDFTSLDGITGIFGPNRSGKSSIVGAIMYTLFNSTDRGAIKNINIINARKNYCRGKALIDINGIDYIIERQTTKHENKQGLVTAATNLNMYRVDEDGELHDVAGEQRFDTDKTIRKMIGTSEDFIRTSLSMQGDHNRFISEGSTQRKLILAKFLDLDIFDAMHDISKRDVADLKAMLKNVQEKDWNTEIKQCKDRRNSSQKMIDKLSQEISEKRIELDQLQIELSKKVDTSTKLVTESIVATQKLKVESLKEKLSTAEEQLREISIDVADRNKKLKVISELKSQYDIKEMRSQRESIRKIEAIVNDLSHKYETELETLKHQQKSASLLKTVPCGDSFPKCKFIKESYKDKERIEKQTDKVNVTLKKLSDAKKLFVDAGDKDLTARIEKFEKVNELEAKLSMEISQRGVDVHKLEMAVTMYQASIEKECKMLSSLEEAMKNEDNVEAISLRKEIEGHNADIRKLDADKTFWATEVGRLKSEIDALIKSSMDHRDLQTKLRYYELIDNAFSKKGIPASIVNRQLPIVNAEIAKILHGIVDFTVELDVDTETNDVPIYINYGDSKRIIELGSGMEKMISSLAIRVALSNVSSLPKTDMFVIDEGFGALDASIIEACNRLLTSLKKNFKNIIVISHVDGIKDIADSIIEITKNEKDSCVQYN